METTFVLLRHAERESSWHQGDTSCPISQRGREKEEKLALLLKEKGYVPSKVFFSPTQRTRETAEILAACPIEECSELSLWGDDQKLLSFLLEQKPEGKTFFLVGHGPTLSSFASRLVGEYISYPFETSSALVLSFKDRVAFGGALFVEYMS